MSDDWEGRHHDHSTEVERSWAVAQLVARNHNLTAILTDLIAELRSSCRQVNNGIDAMQVVYDAGAIADRAEAQMREGGF